MIPIGCSTRLVSKREEIHNHASHLHIDLSSHMLNVMNNLVIFEGLVRPKSRPNGQSPQLLFDSTFGKVKPHLMLNIKFTAYRVKRYQHSTFFLLSYWPLILILSFTKIFNVSLNNFLADISFYILYCFSP